MIRRNAVVLAALAALPLSALAADRVSYSYLDAQYLNTTFDVDAAGTKSPKDKREGLRIGLDISLTPYLFVTTDWDQRLLGASAATGGTALRWSYGDVGVGVHTMERAYQVYGIASYEHHIIHPRDNDPATKDDRGDGYGVEVGGRVPWKAYELHASYKYFNLGKTEVADDVKTSGMRYGAGVAVQLTPWFALTGDWRHVDHDWKANSGSLKWNFDEWLVGFRRYFATDGDKYNRHESVFGTSDSGASTP